jgi:hypothetical protein
MFAQNVAEYADGNLSLLFVVVESNAELAEHHAD